MDTTIQQPKTGLGSVAETNRLSGGQFFNDSGSAVDVGKNTDAQNQVLADANPALFNQYADRAGFSATPINTQNLSNSQTPVNLPPTPVSTSAAGLSGVTEVVKEQNKLIQEQEQKAQEASASLASDKQSLTDTMKQILGIQSSRAQMEKDAGLDVKSQRLTEYTNQLEGLERAELNEIRAVQGRGDISQEAQQGLIQNIQRNYAFQKADVALLQSAANRDYETAFNIVNRKIELALEPLKTQLDFTKFFYQENKDLLTKSEDRAFNSKLNQLNQQYETEKDNRTAIGNIQLEALKNGITIPPSVMAQLNNAKDATEATSILARNGISLQNPLDVQSKKSDIAYKDAQTKKILFDMGDGSGGTTYITRPKLDAQGNTVKDSNGNVVTETVKSSLPLAQAQGNVDVITSLINDKNIRTAVGPTGLARFIGYGYDTATGGRQNYIAGVQQLTSQLSLDSLIRAKAQGATFGALSDSELNVLANSASKLNAWAKKDSAGNVTAYRASEKDFKRELDKINNLAKLDYIIKGGDPMDVGAQMQPDGTIWSKNSDGTLTQIR